ncbi:hypothetical protein CDAR_541861 [Caerostris darwini]|uniref:Secreted protein n=1 Tax=Caerostris darwini TaxID=1538125 RepID=A0AAV4UU60_9ARAC|nr:hypothetical protein CDAR_541861 [Caerostris darwini]
MGLSAYLPMLSVHVGAGSGCRSGWHLCCSAPFASRFGFVPSGCMDVCLRIRISLWLVCDFHATGWEYAGPRRASYTPRVHLRFVRERRPQLWSTDADNSNENHNRLELLLFYWLITYSLIEHCKEALEREEGSSAPERHWLGRSLGLIIAG